MKITLYVPKEYEARKFIVSEITEARNIQDKNTRKSVLSALNKILLAFDAKGPGHAFFSDGDDITVEEYSGKKKLYSCGNKYERIEIIPFDPYLIVVIDAREATIGTTDGDRINVVWSEQSMVPNKHHMGGQSQMRFQRDRERALKEWLRYVSDKVKELVSSREIIVGGPGMTKDKFVQELPA